MAREIDTRRKVQMEPLLSSSHLVASITAAHVVPDLCDYKVLSIRPSLLVVFGFPLETRLLMSLAWWGE
jgi:hypothetical protein